MVTALELKFDSSPRRSESPAESQGVQVTLEKVQVFLSPSPVPDAFESPLELGTLLGRSLRVVEPVQVRFFRDGEHVVAEAPEIEEFGYGANVGEARLDLQRAVCELFTRLRAERERLGSDLVRVLSVLERKLQPRA